MRRLQAKDSMKAYCTPQSFKEKESEQDVWQFLQLDTRECSEVDNRSVKLYA